MTTHYADDIGHTRVPRCHPGFTYVYALSSDPIDVDCATCLELMANDVELALLVESGELCPGCGRNHNETGGRCEMNPP